MDILQKQALKRIKELLESANDNLVKESISEVKGRVWRPDNPLQAAYSNILASMRWIEELLADESRRDK